jgi:hypothetical protein
MDKHRNIFKKVVHDTGKRLQQMFFRFSCFTNATPVICLLYNVKLPYFRTEWVRVNGIILRYKTYTRSSQF